MILQIPPADPSTPLRTTYLLRLTNDIITSVVDYEPDISEVDRLLDWLDDLDQAWIVVLRGDIWDPNAHAEVPARAAKATLPNQTERTRLRSLLEGGKEALEDWLRGLETHGTDEEMKKLQIFESIDDLFIDVLEEMGDVVWDDRAAAVNRGEVGMSDPSKEVTGEEVGADAMDDDPED
jgi:hypothetical protein